jgi:hypothetical protein
MIALSLLVSIVVIPFVSAQSNDTSLQLKAIEAHFTQSQIVPSLLATFDPSALLSVNYAGERFFFYNISQYIEDSWNRPWGRHAWSKVDQRT